MSIKVENLKSVITRLEKIPAEMAQRIDEELTDGAELIEGRQKMLAPVNDGLLRAGNVADTSVPLYKEITNSVFYGPYIEFGTGRKFKGNGRDQIAAQFKGKANRGNFNDMVNNLAEWIRKKGILTAGKRGAKRKDDKYRLAAYWMAIRILQNGIKPQPFFYRAYDEILPSILSNIKKVLTK
jgi:hypothetical protein